MNEVQTTFSKQISDSSQVDSIVSTGRKEGFMGLVTATRRKAFGSDSSSSIDAHRALQALQPVLVKFADQMNQQMSWVNYSTIKTTGEKS